MYQGILNKVNKETQGVLVHRVHQRIPGILHGYTRCTRVHKVYKSIQGVDTLGTRLYKVYGDNNLELI